MAIDNPALLHYFLQDDLYLLNEDKSVYNDEPKQVTATQAEANMLLEATVLLAPIPAPVAETPRPDFKYLGGNKKQFLILVNYIADEHIAETHLKALESTLGRKTLAIDDVAILNTARYTNNGHQELIAFFLPEKLLILGAAAIPAGLTSPQLNVIQQSENRQQLFTHSFEEMLTDREKAKAFWEQMKNL
jgi:hypothetical protein